jgi:hypothetical protein
VGETAGEPGDKPAGETAGEPGDKPAGETAGEPGDKPAGETAGEPGDKPAEEDATNNPANGEVVPAGEQAPEANTPAEPVQTQASPQDIEAAKTAPPVDVDPKPAPKAEVEELRDLVLTGEVKTGGPLSPEATIKVEAKVAQWQPDWVQYDKYYRPLIFNPIPSP